MAYDANLQLASETGKGGTVTNNSTGIDLKTGSLRGPVMWARIEMTAGSASGSDVTFTFSIEHSSDDSTYYAHTSGADQVITITAGGSVRSRDVVWIPIVTEKRYIRLVMTKGGGTMTTGAYNAYITNSHFQ
jgi:hypothetical protein